jgi:TolB protein
MHQALEAEELSMRRDLAFLLIFFLCLSFPFTLRAQDYQADIEDVIQKGIQAIPIAIPDMICRSAESDIRNQSTVCGNALWNDLDNTGIFQLISKTRYPFLSPEGAFNPDYGQWARIGAQALILGTLALEEEKLVAELRVYDIKTRAMRFGKRYIGEKTQIRRIAHTMADDIVRHFTGRKGVANSKIVFCSERDGNKEIYIMDYDGYSQKRLTRNEQIDLSPALSPDGQQIAFTSYRNNNPDLFIMSRFGRNQAPLSSGGGLNATPSWSPDGRQILFTSSRDKNAEIYLISPDGKLVKGLTKNRAIDTSPSWSPTGKEIAFTSDRSGTPQIYTMDREGANITRLTYDGSYNVSPAWSPDGQEIAYVSRIGINFDIFAINVSTGDLRRITIDAGSNEHPKWSPDGRQLAFSSTRSGTSQIYIATRSGDRQKRVTTKGKNTTPHWSR